MLITVIEEFNLNRWDEYMRSFSASPFISKLWLESFRNSERRPIFLRFLCEGETIGIAAGLVVEPSYRILKKLDRTLFFFSGPAFIHSNHIEPCIKELINYATAKGYTRIDLRSWDFPYLFKAENLPFYKSIREEYIISLMEEWGDIQKRIQSAVKNKVRKANRNGVTCHESFHPKLVEDLIYLLEETKSARISKGYKTYSYYYMPYLNKALLYKLLQHKIVKLFYTCKDNEILCAQLIAFYHKRAFLLFTGINPTGYKLGANPFLTFYVIEKLKKEGFEYLNLGGAANDSGADSLIFFKKSFGAEKYLCAGGSTPFLQTAFSYLPSRIYNKIINSSFIRKNFPARFFSKMMGHDIH